MLHVFISMNRIGCVMIGLLAPSAVDRGFEPRSGQTKNYEIGICCFSTRNQSDVSECDDMSISLDCCFSELAL
jgi:hypothetical protein